MMVRPPCHGVNENFPKLSVSDVILDHVFLPTITLKLTLTFCSGFPVESSITIPSYVSANAEMVYKKVINKTTNKFIICLILSWLFMMIVIFGVFDIAKIIKIFYAYAKTTKKLTAIYIDSLGLNCLHFIVYFVSLVNVKS